MRSTMGQETCSGPVPVGRADTRAPAVEPEPSNSGRSLRSEPVDRVTHRSTILAADRKSTRWMCSPLSEVTRGRVVVVDGTLVPTGNRAGQTGLYAGKKRRHGANIQILSDLDGALLAVSAPLPGSVHDRRAIAASGWESSLASTPTLGDLAYQGTFVVTPSRKPPRRQLSRGSEVTNRHHARLRAPVERAIAHLKNWKILATGYRGRLAELSDIIRTITALEFYRRGWKAL